MAHNFAVRARKLAWRSSDDKDTSSIISIRRVGTDSTLNDDDEYIGTSTSIRRVHASEHVDRFVAVLKRDGCVIIDDFTNTQLLEKATGDAKSWLEAQNSGATRHAMPMERQIPTIRNKFLANHTYQELCKEFLTVETTRWREDQPCTEVCQPIVFSASTRKVSNWDTEKPLLRRDAALAVKHEEHHTYEQGQDAMLGLVVPGSRSVHLKILLGSHLYGEDDPDFGKDVVEEELETGQALVMLGSLYHQITTRADRHAETEATLAHVVWSCAGVYRPEE